MMVVTNPRAGSFMLLATWLLLLPGTPAAAEPSQDSCSANTAALVRLAAGRIDAALGAVAASTRVLGREYATADALRAEQLEASGAQVDWGQRRQQYDGYSGFRTWPASRSAAPDFQGPAAGIYRYSTTPLDHTGWHELDVFEALVPVFRAAYHSFDFSWVYLTSVDQGMMIYPYLPPEQAAANQLPTSQVYYLAADFEHRREGWTEPYLDLVGAGMMVTVSFPVYADKLLGVVSRDITLRQLSRSVLAELAIAIDRRVLLVDRNGLAIDASAASMEAEIESVNTAAKAAVLYYRDGSGLAALQRPTARSSAFGVANRAVEAVLAAAGQDSDTGVIELQVDDAAVLAIALARTGWFLVLLPAGGEADAG